MLLAFEAGPLAFVLSEAARHGVQISRFNHRRLGFEIAGRLPDDPWQLDTAGIIEALCAGSMRVSLVRPVEVFDAVLDVPEGLWVPASPFRPPIAGGRQTVQGPKGITPYYADTGRRMIMEIADGGAWCLISPPDSQVFPEP
jgi:hypothetical protein